MKIYRLAYDSLQEIYRRMNLTIEVSWIFLLTGNRSLMSINDCLVMNSCIPGRRPQLSLGLFSLLDAMLDSTMDFICERLSLGDHLNNALIHHTGPYSPYLQLIVSYEKRDKPGCLAAMKEIGLGLEKLHQMYMNAISFAESVLG